MGQKAPLKQIAVYGAGGFGREVRMLINQINQSRPEWEFIGYFDDGVAPNTVIDDKIVLGGLPVLNDWSKDLSVVFAIGNPIVKARVIKSTNNPNISYPVLVHPNVLLGIDKSSIGEGTIICGGNIITVSVELGRHIILNLACTVGHDSIIQDYCSFMPGINISGEVIIETGVYVGTGAKILNQLSIGQSTIVGAGAVVSKSLPANCTAVGVPAKPIKYHEQ